VNQLKYVILILICLGCSQQNQSNDWAAVIVNLRVRENAALALRDLDCNVMSVRIDDHKDKFEPTNYRECQAELKKDSLRLKIGFNSLFGGHGIDIILRDGKFNVQPYEYSDIITLGQKEMDKRYIVEKQKLILSTAKFAVGDTVYGHLYSRIRDDKKTKYYAIGFFKAKVLSGK
jgi:hypothetical protein